MRKKFDILTISTMSLGLILLTVGYLELFKPLKLSLFIGELGLCLVGLVTATLILDKISQK